MMDYDKVIDIESAKERFMGNYKLFSKFLFQFPDRSLFGDLKKQVEEKDIKKSFETAHTMKGITANLSLKLIEKPLFSIVEDLRAGNLPKEEDWASLVSAYETTITAIGELKEKGTPLF